MSDCKHNHEHSSHVCHINANSDLYQTLDELEFERGIWAAAQCGDLDRLQLLLRNGNDVNRPDNGGYVALHYAARNGHLIVCQCLINNGACVNAATRAGGATALHRASTAGKLEIVKYLLSKNADVRFQDADGKTALHRAAENKHEEIYRLLLNEAPDLEHVHDNKMKSPLDYK